METNNNFFVLTGGPGVGKTSLLEELRQRNYQVVPEIAREIIREQLKVDGQALPWKDKDLYKETMLERSVLSYQSITNQYSKEPVFFDRGILDTLCYTKLIESDITDKMDFYARTYRYNRMTFLLPPWKEIYRKDNERKQTWKEAVLTYQVMAETYEEYGYKVVELPKTFVTERADFLLDILRAEGV